MTIERYIIEINPKSITIILDQKKNALINITISLLVIFAASYMVGIETDNEGFFYVLIVFGTLWFAGSILGYNAKRTYMLSKSQIVFDSPRLNEPKKLQKKEMDHISLKKIIRPTGRQRSADITFKWRVSIVDVGGEDFKEIFQFEKESNARSMSNLLSGFFGLAVILEEKG